MFKMDRIKNLLNCDFCNELLINPVSISCGSNICKKHLDKLVSGYSKDMNTFTCILCREEHFIPKNGFTVNTRIQQCLELQLNTLKPSPVYDECKVEIQQAKKNIETMKSLQLTPGRFISEYFDEIKGQVTLRRDNLKTKIDTCYSEVIHSIEKTQSDCINLALFVDQITINIEKSKKELDDYIKRFDSFEFNDNKYETIKKSVTVLNKNYESIISKYKNSLIGNYRYSFQHSNVNLFGSFVSSRKFDSAILNTSHLQTELFKICEFPISQQWELKYRASRDGFGAHCFHSRCDGIPNTLTIIKSTNGNIFGGFAEQEWSKESKNESATDCKAFIFSLINKENKPFKANCSKNKEKSAILCSRSNGPVFGYSPPVGKIKIHRYDIFISSDSNKNLNSSTQFGATYHHPDYQVGTKQANQIFAGSRHFDTLDIEVFVKAN